MSLNKGAALPASQRKGDVPIIKSNSQEKPSLPPKRGSFVEDPKKGSGKGPQVALEATKVTTTKSGNTSPRGFVLGHPPLNTNAPKPGSIPSNGNTAVHVAAMDGDAARLHALLSTSPDLLNLPNTSGATALHLAASGNCVTCVKVLLEKGADVDKVDNEGGTALHHAAANNSAAAVALLIQGKAKTDVFDSEGFAPIHHSAYNACADSLSSLLTNGADIELKDKEEGSTALHIAAFVGSEVILTVLLRHGPNISAVDNDMATPVHKAAFKGHKECITLLVKHGASVNSTDATLSTPLHMAAYEGHPGVIRCLLDHNATLDIPNKHGRTAMQLAMMRGQQACVFLLAKAGGKLIPEVAEAPNSGPPPENKGTSSPRPSSPHRPIYPNFISMSGPQPTTIVALQLRTQSERNFKSTDAKSDGSIRTINAADGSTTPKGGSISGAVIAEKTPIKELAKSLDIPKQDQERDSSQKIAMSRSDKGDEAEEEIADYSKVDKWGFVLNDPKKQKLGIREKEREAKAALKWYKMISTWSTWKKKESQLLDRVLKGIPDSVRGTVWKLFMGVDERKAALTKGKPAVTYGDVVGQGTQAQDAKQIDLDIRRTYRNHFMFRASQGVGQQALGNVLKAYAFYDKEVGYCQGMSSVTALMLMYMEEEDAWWSLLCLLARNGRFSMTGLYKPGFPKLMWCFRTHESLLATHLPALATHMQREGIETSMYATKWYQTLFLEALPFPVVVRLWDILLCCGYEAVFAIVLAVLTVLEEQLRGMAFEDLLTFLVDGLPKHTLPADQLLRPFKKLYKKLKAQSSPRLVPSDPADL